MKKRVNGVHFPSGIKLDLGCGMNKQTGWTGMDKRTLKGVDIVHDIEVTPWPLADDCALVILCSHILEHIDPRNFFSVMAEIHRVGQHGCQVQISTPYANSFGAYQDPSHTRPGFCEASFIYFDPRPYRKQYNHLYSIYSPPPFFTQRIQWDPNGNLEALLLVIKDEELIKQAHRQNRKCKVDVEQMH